MKISAGVSNTTQLLWRQALLLNYVKERTGIEVPSSSHNAFPLWFGWRLHDLRLGTSIEPFGEFFGIDPGDLAFSGIVQPRVRVNSRRPAPSAFETPYMLAPYIEFFFSFNVKSIVPAAGPSR